MLNNLTFSGGKMLNEHKEFSENAPLVAQEMPEFIYVPLLQGTGTESTPIVKKGDMVKTGQKIGDIGDNWGVCVHSSVTGTVTGIEEMYTAEGKLCKCVVIQCADTEEIENFTPHSTDDLSVEKVYDIARESGIVGMGGGGFPFCYKFSGAKKSEVDSVIANGAECEPFLTSDHQAMLHNPEKLLKGVSLATKVLGADAAYIAIEDNKKNALDLLDKYASDYENVTVASMITKYPQGDSTRVIDSVLNRKVPAGQRSGSVKAFVSNVQTFMTLYDAITEGKPSYERIISVTGPGVKEPKNIIARVGTRVIDLINQCGGFKGKVISVVSGGPMSGNQIFDLNSPITKTTTGIVVITDEYSDLTEESPCIKCSRCVEACPSKLNPSKIDIAILKHRDDLAEKMHAEECIQCGTCSFVCPAKRHLAETIKIGLNQIKKRKTKSK